MKNFKKPLLAVLVFLLMQAVGGIVITTPYALYKTMTGGSVNSASMPSSVLALTVAVTGILTALVMWKGMKMIRNTAFSLQGNKASLLGIGFLAALFCIMGTDLLSELFDLPNLMEDQMLGMAGTVMGALAIGVIGPVAEELVFREAILGHLLRRGTSPWLAMVASALLFGLIHLNPAQVPFAAAMGLVLAIVYYRTGNIVLTSIIHIFNNSLAVLEMNLLGDKAKTFTLTNDVLGGQTNAIVCIIVSLIVGIMLLRMFWQKTEAPVWGIKDEA